jgi:ABC-type dipeptide/oligopeptide/nickel transport system ATPase component
MQAGEAVERGSIGELLAAPRHPYTAAFAASAYRIEADLSAAIGPERDQ